VEATSKEKFKIPETEVGSKLHNAMVLKLILLGSPPKTVKYLNTARKQTMGNVDLWFNALTT
jgi:hypothetical protein